MVPPFLSSRPPSNVIPALSRDQISDLPLARVIDYWTSEIPALRLRYGRDDRKGSGRDDGKGSGRDDGKGNGRDDTKGSGRDDRSWFRPTVIRFFLLPLLIPGPGGGILLR